MGYQTIQETMFNITTGETTVADKEIWVDDVPTVSVPSEIRMAQCRAQLIIDGKDGDVEALLSAIEDPVKQKLYRTYFEYEPIIKRDNAMINEMAPMLGIDLDEFFVKASNL